VSTSEIKIILKALDEASATLRRAADTIEGKLDAVEKANTKVEKSSKNVEMSTKDVALAWNNAATGAFALYNAVDRVMDMQVNLDRANIQVKASAGAVERAQRQYNDAVDKFGASGDKAVEAQKQLELAQERYNYAVDRADMLQGNFNEAMVQSALTIMPSVITVVSSAEKVLKSFGEGGKAAVEKLGSSLSALASNPLVLVTGGLAVMAGAAVFAWTKFNENIAKQEEYKQSCARVEQALRQVNDAMAITVEGTEDLTRKVGLLDSATKTLNQELEFQQKRYEELINLGPELRYFRGVEIQNVKDEKEATEKSIEALKEAIDLTHRQTVEARLQLSTAEIYFDRFTKKTDEYGASLRSTADTIMNVFDESTRTVSEKTDIAGRLIAMFAAKWDTSFSTASGEISKAMDDIIKAMENVPDATQNIPDDIRRIWEGLPDGLRPSIEEFINMLEGVPDAVEENLVSDAQRALQAFVDCSNNKYERLKEQADAYAKELEDKFGKAYQEAPWSVPLPLPPGTVEMPAYKEAAWTLPGFPNLVPAPKTEETGSMADWWNWYYSRGPGAKPLGGGGGGPEFHIEIHAPLVNVEGSADRSVATVAAAMVQQSLKNVVVEISSSAADEEHKQISVESGWSGPILPGAGSPPLPLPSTPKSSYQRFWRER
jgi:tetratricopeptide (TPR) repeat protein